MGRAVDPGAVTTAIAIASSLLAGFFGMWAAMRPRKNGAADRDTAVSVLFTIAVLLSVLTVVAAVPVAVSGMGYVGLLKAVLLMTAAFAVTGMAFGLSRGLRTGKAIKPRRA